MEIVPFLASPLHTLQVDGIPLGRELSSCCPYPGPWAVPRLTFSWAESAPAGPEQIAVLLQVVSLSSALGNQLLMKGKCTLNPKRLSSLQTLRTFPPFISLLNLFLSVRTWCMFAEQSSTDYKYGLLRGLLTNCPSKPINIHSLVFSCHTLHSTCPYSPLQVPK